MRVGIDYRPALLDRGERGRAVRELVRALAELSFDRDLGLYGYTAGAARVPRGELGLDGTRAELVRLRLPDGVQRWLLARLGRGADDLVGGCAVFHHTSAPTLPVREAAEVVTVQDCAALVDADYLPGPDREREAAHLRALVQRSRRVLVPTEFTAAEVVLHCGVYPGQVSVVGTGCDHLVPHRVPGRGASEPGAPFLLTVGEVGHRGNQLRTLWAFERLAREGFPHRWVLVGEPGHGAGELERALAASPARDRVTWHRRVSDAELAALYRDTELVLAPELYSGSGHAALEAMACEAPVLTSAITALAEVAGEAASPVEPSDQDAIFEAARRLLAAPELRADLVLRGKQAARRHTWREVARDTLAAYRLAVAPEDQPALRRTL